MPRIKYIDKKMGADRLAVVRDANAICAQYASQDLSLTLRQLYYQFVARGLLPNRQSEYKRLGDILNDARMAGLMDWDYLVDRTRNLQSLPHWGSPASIIRSAAASFRRDVWAEQHQRVEVWIEKDAGIGVIESVCEGNDVPYFSCRGYTSVSEIWGAAQRIREYLEKGDAVTILHIGDHDPSGIDMTRDIDDRLRTFITQDWLNASPTLSGTVTVRDILDDINNRLVEEGGHYADSLSQPWQIKRIALNYDQVLEYSPPPNPAKQTDARYQRYVENTGLDESWELDALDPFVLQDLIQTEIDEIRDPERWEESQTRQEKERALLTQTSHRWAEVVEFLDGDEDDEEDEEED